MIRSLISKSVNIKSLRVLSNCNYYTASNNVVKWKTCGLKSFEYYSISLKKPELRYFCSSTGDRSNDDNDNPDIPPVEVQGTSLYPTTVPDNFPTVPMIALNSNPLFPKFVKMIEVTDPKLIKLLRRRISLGLPYAGVFVKKDRSSVREVVDDISEVHDVGTFVQVMEPKDFEKRMVMIVVGHRRIKIVKKIEMKDADVVSLKTDQNVTKRNSLHKRKKAIADTKATTEPLSDDDRVLMVETINLYNDPYTNDMDMKAFRGELLDTIRELIHINEVYRESVRYFIENQGFKDFSDDPAYLSDMGAALCGSADAEELQEVLEEIDIKKRVMLSLNLVKKELEISRLQKKIGKDVEEKVKQHHRKYMLHEQLKAIKRELGIEKDDKSAILEKFNAKIENLTLPEHVKEAIDEEMNKLNYLDNNSSEFNVSRNYLDWLTNIPWGIRSEENYDLELAHKILEEDHYGLEDVKKRILEFIAVSTLKGGTQGKILCFYGPPGVGKTSFARSIARALNRKYYRFSVGGMSDVSEIKGHRRTYVGAMPGKIIQGLKKAKTENPLILIDEVDKIGKGWQGDPTSALLELLDPEQNCNFLDHYLDVSVDLSKVLFICTANVWTLIPDPLRDRMEMIEISGYIGHEKIAIAKNYLIPKTEEECGINKDKEEKQVLISDASLEVLIKQYCRESGVRHLQKKIEQIMRKSAFKLVKGESELPLRIEPDTLEKYVGKPNFTTERLYADPCPAGVAVGLAWNSMGGSVLYLETSTKLSRDEILSQVAESQSHRQRRRSSIDNSDDSGNGSKQPVISASLDITGHLGDVMKESIKIAHTYSLNFASFVVSNNSSNSDTKMVMKDATEFLRVAPMHIHVPEGATPKDGPSAGVTIVTALLSLAMNIPIKHNIAMTGEISLTGKILPIGGLKEKVIAARRSGINEVIIPMDNKKDYNELSSMITDGLTVHFASHYNDIFPIMFPSVSV